MIFGNKSSWGVPVMSTGEPRLEGSGSAITTTGQVVPNDWDELVDSVTGSVDSSSNISDAKTYGDVKGSTVEEQLEWLYQNDPENATGWMESLMGYRASKESLQDARAYERWREDTRIQRAVRDLEAAGINPILAYQYLSGTSGSLGTAGSPDFNVSTNATSRENNKRTVEEAKVGNIAKIGAILGAIIGIILKKKL